MQINHQIHSKNYDLRQQDYFQIKYLILHYTEMRFDDAISKLCDKGSKVSSHYLIHKNGTIYQLVGDFYRAWHAGRSKWNEETEINNSSIGIEIDNLCNEEYTNEQLNSLIQLCYSLQKKYNHSSFQILGHSDIAPQRKIDPGLYFNWWKLSRRDIGIKFKKDSPISNEPIKLTKSKISEIQKRLKSLGYDIEITNTQDEQTNNVFRAFQLHFSPESIIKSGGIEFLQHQYLTGEGKYIWDRNSDNILNWLTTKNANNGLGPYAKYL